MKKPIKGYESNYFITDSGEIYSNPRKGTVSSERLKRKHKNKFGYYQVVLMKDGVAKTHLVHRLMAINFIDNPFCLEQVNHKDGNKLNNNVSNLEWCSKRYNTQHAFNNNLGNFKTRALQQIKKINDEKKYDLVVLEKCGKQIFFNSTKEASSFLETDKDNVSRAFRKKQKCKGFSVLCFRTANGEALASNVEGNPVGNSEKRTCIDYPSEGE